MLGSLSRVDNAHTMKLLKHDNFSSYLLRSLILTYVFMDHLSREDANIQHRIIINIVFMKYNVSFSLCAYHLRKTLLIKQK